MIITHIMKRHIHFLGIGFICCCTVLTSCEQKGAQAKLHAEIAKALEDVDDKSSADDAAQDIREALREYKKSKVDQEILDKRYKELRHQIREKKYYDSTALGEAL